MRILNLPLYVCLLLLLFQVNALGQSRYAVNKLPFSSPEYDEFSPSVWNDSLIFCSNQENEFLLTYHDGHNKGLMNLFLVRLDQEALEMEASVFSKSLVTPFNDGPASFSPDGKQLVYSRNLEVKARRRNILKLSNNLGIYFAHMDNGTWVLKEEFPYNHPDYSLTTPCFGPEGRYLYFASNMPGGFGGTDLYRSEWKDGAWNEPMNLGGEINTNGNEVYPFIADNKDLFYASDGHPGLGGKDIYLSRPMGDRWNSPLHLEYPLNSKEDDFGLVTNGTFSEGYLSSSRELSDDIYRFYTHIPQLFDCDSMLINNHCYEFWDEDNPGVDSLPVIYEWTFSDGAKVRGLRVSHCFPNAGSHWAKLNIIDNRTDTSFYTQTSMEFELTDHEQAFITSSDKGLVNVAMDFSGLNSNIPGFVTEQYIWDFGDGGFAEGLEAEHVYGKPGSYSTKLGLKGYLEGASELQIRCVQKTVVILLDN